MRKPKKPRRRGKHGISIENIAHDYTKNINHLNSWRCLCFLMQDLFQKSDQKLHVYDFSNVFSRTLLTIWHGSQCFFWTKMSNSILNFISQEERNIKHFQFWTVEIVHCHIDGSAAQWHGPWTQHVNRSSHARIFLNERTKPCYCKVESKVHSWNQNMQFLLVIKWNDCSAVISAAQWRGSGH